MLALPECSCLDGSAFLGLGHRGYLCNESRGRPRLAVSHDLALSSFSANQPRLKKCLQLFSGWL